MISREFGSFFLTFLTRDAETALCLVCASPSDSSREIFSLLSVDFLTNDCRSGAGNLGFLGRFSYIAQTFAPYVSLKLMSSCILDWVFHSHSYCQQRSFLWLFPPSLFLNCLVFPFPMIRGEKEFESDLLRTQGDN